ncbi:metalloregulator ArsR/SmtB family transcription factor [Litoribacillus peritrichatus]|uniref:Metalloregulator ArsR/SmtB family transcription factor n=1 Tax=Litoribacillus peritrichatus TaxID=718191 RepID=A0ABP7MU44_9GAMM
MNPVELYKCLADDTRLKSLLLITEEGELCVCELTEALKESQPKISRHLAQLRKFGLLSDRRQGQWIYYSLSPDLESWANIIIQTTLENNRHYLSEAFENLNTMGDRPERIQSCCTS